MVKPLKGLRAISFENQTGNAKMKTKKTKTTKKDVNEQNQQNGHHPNLRFWVETFYDFQKQRIMTGSRIGSIVIRKLEPDTWQKKKEKSEKSMGVEYNIEEVKQKYKKNLEKFTAGEIDEVDRMLTFYSHTEKLEDNLKADITFLDGLELVHTSYLKDIGGIGPILAGGLIAWIGDISKFPTISKLWAYAGLNTSYVLCECEDKHKQMVAVWREGLLCRHLNCNKPLVHVEDMSETPARKAGYNSYWNPKLKMHCWKIGEQFVKTKGFYRDLYDKYKAYEQQLHPKEVKVGNKTLYTKGHIHARAKRKVVKVFLANLWMAWRKLESLPVTKPYCEEYLDHKTVQQSHQTDETQKKVASLGGGETQGKPASQSRIETQKKVASHRSSETQIQSASQDTDETQRFVATAKRKRGRPSQGKV